MNNDINEKIVHAAPVPPFVRFVASAVPMVFDNSLSYYECLCALWKWMQDNLVDVINNNATVTEHYIDLDLETRALFNQLKTYVDTYFDNLDVQDEINNKLDDMAEAGTLQEIITTYIQSNVAWTFDSVADMKLATNLVDGSYARTLGFYTINDGGGALYKITDTGTANEIDTIAIGALYANLIIENEMSVAQFGAKGDGINDDADNLIVCFNRASNIRFAEGATYLSSKDIQVSNSGVVNLNGSTVQMYDRLAEGDSNICIFNIRLAKNVEFMNGILVGDIDERETYPETIAGLRITESENINVHNLKVSKCTTDGITTSGSIEFIDIHDCEVYSCGRNNISLLYGDNCTLHDINTHDCQGKNTPGHGLVVEPYDDDQPVNNLEIYNIYAKDNYGAGIDLSFFHNGVVSAFVHDIYSLDPFIIKGRDDSVGVVTVNNIYLESELDIRDTVSSDFSVFIDGVVINNYVPVLSTSYWGAAIKIRSGLNSTGTNLYNTHLKNIVIEGGEPTRAVYISGGSSGSNNTIDNIDSRINTIQVITGTSAGWNVTGIKSDYVYSTSSGLGATPVNNLVGNITVASNFMCRDKIKLVNDTTTSKSVTTQANNQYGTITFLVPAKSFAYIKVNSDGTAEVEGSKIGFNVLANSTISLNLSGTPIVASTRSTHYMVYYAKYDGLIQLAADSGTGATLSVSNGVLTAVADSNNSVVWLS